MRGSSCHHSPLRLQFPQHWLQPESHVGRKGGCHPHGLEVVAGAAGTCAMVTVGIEDTRMGVKASGRGSLMVVMVSGGSSHIGVMVGIVSSHCGKAIASVESDCIMTALSGHVHPMEGEKRDLRASPGVRLWWIGRLPNWQKKF